MNLSKAGTYTLSPGVWNSIKISGQAGDVTLKPGVYVVTGAITVSGQGGMCAGGTIISGTCNALASDADSDSDTDGATLYLGCPGGTVGGNPHAYLSCNSSGGAGGSLSFTGKGDATIYSPACPTGAIVGQNNGCTGYEGVAVISDPHLIDPGGASACAATGTGCAVAVSGNGNSINGSVDTRGAGLALTGGGSDKINQGFLIGNSVFINDNGKAGTGWALSGPGSYSATLNASACVLVLNVYTGAATPVPSTASLAVVQSQCVKGTSTISGVVDFNYSP